MAALEAAAATVVEETPHTTAVLGEEEAQRDQDGGESVEIFVEEVIEGETSMAERDRDGAVSPQFSTTSTVSGADVDTTNPFTGSNTSLEQNAAAAAAAITTTSPLSTGPNPFANSDDVVVVDMTNPFANSTEEQPETIPLSPPLNGPSDATTTDGVPAKSPETTDGPHEVVATTVDTWEKFEPAHSQESWERFEEAAENKEDDEGERSDVKKGQSSSASAAVAAAGSGKSKGVTETDIQVQSWKCSNSNTVWLVIYASMIFMRLYKFNWNCIICIMYIYSKESHTPWRATHK